MPRFFIKAEDTVNNNNIILRGDSAHHISYSLRMKVGDTLTVCDFFNYEYECVIDRITGQEVALCINSKKPSSNEPSVKVSLFQAVPKSTKLELIIQKCVELGISEIVPVITSRCISRPEKDSFSKKAKRWNAISEEAAKQSGRGKVPEVYEPLSFEDAIERMKEFDISFMCYECADEKSPNIRAFLSASFESILKEDASIAFFVGPEGGISDDEAEYAASNGVKHVSLGKRILRTETAPIAVLSCVMYETGNLS